jgi:PIN domain nuclease of toxin-antitoxin system
MRLLIDTHALIWFCEGSPALSATARAAMEDAGNERFVSHATPSEMAIKLALGKLQLRSFGSRGQTGTYYFEQKPGQV